MNAADLLAQSRDLATNFIAVYNAAFQENRAALAAFYRPHCEILWNGKPFSQAAAFVDFLNQLPPTKMFVYSIDCHPLPPAGSAPQGASFALAVHGQATIQGATLIKKTLVRNVFLESDPARPGTFAIVSDRFRLFD